MRTTPASTCRLSPPSTTSQSRCWVERALSSSRQVYRFSCGASTSRRTFRKTGKQRAHVWMSGFVHADGYGADERVQFGQREAPVLCGRQSCFLVWAIRRELDRLDAAYPPTDPLLRELDAGATAAQRAKAT